MVKQKALAKCFLTSSIMLVVSLFGYLVDSVNYYDGIVDDTSEVISAFDG